MNLLFSCGKTFKQKGHYTKHLQHVTVYGLTRMVNDMSHGFGQYRIVIEPICHINMNLARICRITNSNYIFFQESTMASRPASVTSPPQWFGR